ncbi:sugar kinase [Roseibium sp.]|uniref:sugar kinase n=1 Tax=Roseibium sp. TaxID=1936156 RepID=UPI003D0B1257
MARRFVAIGECMVEFSPTREGTYAIGFAGDTFNTAWYARQLAGPADLEVAYFSAVGDDELSRQLTVFMQEAGISPKLKIIGDAGPGMYMIFLNNGERSFQYWRSQSAARHLADDLENLPDVDGGDVVYFSGITIAILPEAGRERLLEALRHAAAKGAEVVFDPNLRPRLWQSEEDMCRWTMKAAALSGIVLPSFEDEARHFGDKDAQATADRYLANGARLAVVKNGEDPVVVQSADGDGFRYQPEAATRVVDTTAAGDSFNAAFLVEYLGRPRPREAVRAGCALARHVIGHRGALVPVSKIDVITGKARLSA